MSVFRTLVAVVRADVRERTRRYGFLLTMGGAVYLGYAVNAGYVVMHLDNYRGVYNSAWIGTLTAMSTVLFVSLVGFYAVKNAIDRDRVTRVGQILAATPLSKFMYLLAKFLSNFWIFSLIIAVQATAAIVMQLFAGNEAGLDLSGLLMPFLLIAMPALAIIAALAVLFECIPFLMSGLGNVLYFFVWGLLLVGSTESKNPHLDFACLNRVEASLRTTVLHDNPSFTGGFSLNAGPATSFAGFKVFQWDGIEWPAEMVVARLAFFLYALALVLLASLLFDRFDMARASSWRTKTRTKKSRGTSLTEIMARVTSLGFLSPTSEFGQLFLAELRLMLKGHSVWWYLGALGFVIAQMVAPLDSVKNIILPLSWLWPVLLWSQMGIREDRFDTVQLLCSTPNFVRRQLPLLWLSGVAVAFFTGVGALIALSIAGDLQGVILFFVAAMFIPALALAMGVWSRSSKMFEALYTVWWYIGPMEHTQTLDFIGLKDVGPHYLLFTGVLLAAAFLGRRQQISTA